MNDTLTYAEYLQTVKVKATELETLLQQGLGFKLDKVLQTYASLFDRFCPYNVGDRVQLKEGLNISQDSGWYGSKHFLVEGAIATVKTRGDYQNDLFCFGLTFDDESYINSIGEIKPITEKHLYYLSEAQIKAVENVKT